MGLVISGTVAAGRIGRLLIIGCIALTAATAGFLTEDRLQLNSELAVVVQGGNDLFLEVRPVTPTTYEGLARPWSHLEARVGPMHVEHMLFGAVFVASAVLTQRR